MALLNGLLELDEAHRVVEVELLSPEQRPVVQELMSSIVDVKCVDARGTRYVVEMQVLNVEGFEKPWGPDGGLPLQGPASRRAAEVE